MESSPDRIIVVEKISLKISIDVFDITNKCFNNKSPTIKMHRLPMLFVKCFVIFKIRLIMPCFVSPNCFYDLSVYTINQSLVHSHLGV